MTRDDILIELHSNTYKPKRDLEGLPMEIIASMLYNQALQGNDVDTKVFEEALDTQAQNGGFDWERTTEGKDFWVNVLDPFKVDDGIHAFYDEYDRSLSVYQYFVDKIIRNNIEFTGEIESFPTPVVAMMMAEQWNQGKRQNISAFYKDSEADKATGGFDWVVSPEGEEFWERVIGNKDFDFFFETYPQTKNSTSNIAMRQEDILLDLAKQGYEPEGEIKDFPLEIVSQMLYEQVKQGNPLDVSVFERSKAKSKIFGGFSHRESDQGEGFWELVLLEPNKEAAFRKYYEFNERNIELYCYALDLLIAQNPSLEFKGIISDYPIEVIAMMIAESMNQGAYVPYQTFEKDITIGFTWRLSPEGEEFWSKVLGNKDFKTFFTEYPDLENECKQINNLNAIKSGKIKKDISVKDFMKDNKSNLQALERRSKEVFDLTVELLTQLQILEDRQKQAKVEPKAKPKAKSKAKPKAKKQEPKKKTTTPTPKKEKSKPKEVVIEELDFDDDDLDFGKGGTTIDLQDLDF